MIHHTSKIEKYVQKIMINKIQIKKHQGFKMIKTLKMNKLKCMQEILQSNLS